MEKELENNREKNTITEPARTSLKKSVKNEMKAFWDEEDGVGVVEIILILVVLISLVAIFKKQLTSIVKTLLSKVESDSNGI